MDYEWKHWANLLIAKVGPFFKLTLNSVLHKRETLLRFLQVLSAKWYIAKIMAKRTII